MARTTEMTQSSKKKEKYSAPRLRQVIREHRIQFKGPVRRRDWPNEHKKLFTSIQAIFHLRYDELQGSKDTSPLTVNKIKKCARELQSKASHCRNIRANEDKWIYDVLPFITRQIEANVVCSRCRRDIMTSHFAAILAVRDRVLEPVLKQAERKLCRCDHMLGNGEDRDDDGGRQIFDTRCGEIMAHHPKDKLDGLRISMSPDQTVGLLPTTSFNKYIAGCSPDIAHSPFDDKELLYPFIVIEAKREKNSPGFESVETQTAFPLRRLLKLQGDLRATSGVNFDPLVWFFAFQGEEWRLYAGILKDSAVVIDIWHGCITSHDGALQLLLITDYIFLWARYKYRPKIRECLARVCRNKARRPLSRSVGQTGSAVPRHDLKVESGNSTAPHGSFTVP